LSAIWGNYLIAIFFTIIKLGLILIYCHLT
jgi:hypothetical protein